jgi:type IV secretion system protein VirB10
MSDQREPRKVDPEALALRAKPRPVVRFKRNILVGIAAALCLAVFAATWVVLGQGGIRSPVSQDDLYSVDHKRAPDQLASLPSSYDKVKLGPPLPGDLGYAAAQNARSLGVSTPNPSSADTAEQAENLRLAQEARQANESGVFFRVSDQGNVANSAAGTPLGQANSSPSIPPMNSASDQLNLDPARDPNSQGRKLDFVRQKAEAEIYNPHPLQEPVSPYEILAGTIIPASLITGLNSDLPGLVIAQITESVFDSVTGTILLVPQGARLIGTYDSVVAYGQKRALVVWQRIVMPNGTSIQIDNLPATDTQGYAGLEDEVDYHTWSLLKGIALSTLLGVGAQTTFGDSQSNLVEAIRESTQESTTQAGQRIVERNLNVQPTITIRPGARLNVVTHKDLILQPYREQQP